MAAEGKQLEALIGLASQICYVHPPQCFVQRLESRIIGETCIKLVDTLNSNKRPSHEYPRMRRAIVEMVLSVLGRYPHYAIIFRREGMMNALSKAEMSPSKVEKYRIFLGNEGVVLENGMPLRDLVARARGLIDSATLDSRCSTKRPCVILHILEQFQTFSPLSPYSTVYCVIVSRALLLVDHSFLIPFLN